MRINSIKHRNNPNFSANIEFCNRRTIIRKLFRKDVVNVSEFSSFVKEPKFDVKESRRGRKIGTAGMVMCNAGGITGLDTKNNLVFHLYPRDFIKNNLEANLISLSKKFKETLQKLKKEGKTPEGLIFGGTDTYEHSRELLVILKHFFEVNNIKPTIFWGTDGNKFGYELRDKNIYYNGVNTWLVNVIRKITRNKAVNSFDFIRVSPNDRVKFSNTDWISGKNGSLNKGHIDLTIQDVLKKYNVSPEILDKLQVKP